MNPMRRAACAAAMMAIAGVGSWPAVATCAAKLLPPEGRTLLIVGQDLDTLEQYREGCRECPVPGGVTAYLGFYDLLSAGAHQFGGLGEDPEGKPAEDGDWGAGRTSARRTAAEFPQSALVLGLDISNGRQKDGLAGIARGKHDDKILRLAAFLRSLDRPVYLRIGYEFDGAWNQGYDDAATYVRAYRRIVDLLRAHGADDVAYVWQASASPVDDLIEGGRHERLRDWYPGADYVDWMGLSWFLTPTATPRVGGLTPPTQRALADEVLALARAEGKPVMIAEAAPQGYDLGRGSKSNISPIWDGEAGTDTTAKSADEIWREWFDPLFAYVEANRHTIRALAYINTHWDAQRMWGPPYAQGYWGDSRIHASAPIEQRWLAQLKSPLWLHGGPTLSRELGLHE